MLEKIKEFFFKYKFIIVSFLIIFLFMVLNRIFWAPTLSKYKRNLKEQEKNQQLIKEREESKLKITSKGVYFLPQGERKIKKNRIRTKKNVKKNVKVIDKKAAKLSEEIEKKIEYLYVRMVKIGKDTSEFEYTGKKLFVPFYETERKNKNKNALYKPNYNLNVLSYKGFYSINGKKTAIVDYNGKKYYLNKWDKLDGTSLSVFKINDDNLVLKDINIGKNIIVNK